MKYASCSLSTIDPQCREWLERVDSSRLKHLRIRQAKERMGLVIDYKAEYREFAGLIPAMPQECRESSMEAFRTFPLRHLPVLRRFLEGRSQIELGEYVPRYPQKLLELMKRRAQSAPDPEVGKAYH